MDASLLLQNIGKRINLDKDEQEYFVSLLQARRIQRKGFLLRQGEYCRTENFIIKGCLRAYSVDENGVEHMVMFGIEDWWISDMYSYLTQTPARLFIDAIEDTEVLQVTKSNMDMLLDKIPKFERFFRILLQQAFISQQDRIIQNLSYTAEERYFQFRKKYPQLEQRLPQKLIASYLGITPVFLSMLRRRQVPS